MWLHCRKSITLVQAFGNGRSSHARCCLPVGEPANSTPYSALIMRAVFFVRVVGLWQTTRTRSAGTHTRALSMCSPRR